jgi:pimeloyl-ACP methyl ester carboxylesterase
MTQAGQGRARGRQPGRGAARRLATTAGGVAREGAWIAAHAALYPFGLVQERFAEVDRNRLDDLPPLQRALLIGDVEAAGTPILLVHGFVDNRSIFAVLRRQLRRRGFGRIVALNYSVLTGDVRAAAGRLGAVVERLSAETGYDRVHVVGHSLGGLIARYYVQRRGGDARVHTLVTLGTPHAGTLTARMVPARVCRQLRPGSDVVRELREPAVGCRTRLVAVWSDLDQLMIPRSTARIDHPDLRATNIGVRGVGHLSLPISGEVVHHICSVLAHLDADGTPLTAGVTPLDGAARPAPPFTASGGAAVGDTLA